MYLHEAKPKHGISLLHSESMPLVSPVINHSRECAVVVFAICLIITMIIILLWVENGSYLEAMVYCCDSVLCLLALASP